MSDSRAIAAVTETLRSIIDAGVKTVDPGAQAITTPPHEISAAENLRVNLFLYQLQVDGALRNTDPPHVLPGETGRPALPVVLQYIVTPYVSDGDDVKAHRLLGATLQALHSHERLTATDLADHAPYSDVSRQVEYVRVSWQPIDDREIYSLWSVFQAPYRISAAFEARVVLIDSTVAGTAPVPVLTRGADGRGPVVSGSVGLPEITQVLALNGQPSVLAGESVTLQGSMLQAQTVTVVLTHPLLTDPVEEQPTSATPTEVVFTMPATLPAGFGTVTLRLESPGAGPQPTTVQPLAIAPKLTDLPVTVAGGSGLTDVTVTCEPDVRVGQTATLLVADAPTDAEPFAADTGQLTFRVRVGSGPAQYPIRLRVDGVDTRLVADRTAVPPAFDPAQRLEVT
jgi:Pvc16 N-terminal domain